MIKLHKLFLNDGHSSSLDVKIPPTAEQRQVLVDAKNAIRDTLRDKIRAASIEVLGMPRMVSPRFRTQGSWAYRTCIQPSHQQEMDWDFGVYLPVAVWIENGPPKPMAKLYFDLVERALEDLCRQRGWRLVSGKSTCVRVKVADWAHIDVPLYAASETEFEKVAEKALATAQNSTSFRESGVLSESASFGEMPEAFWEQIEGIHLACRNGEWRLSDPEAVAIWFNDRVADHGEQLRRVCRYAKAWRDFQWPKGDGPSSVALMIAIAQSFDAKTRRDDLAIEHAAHSLAAALAADIREPGIDDGKEDFNRLDGTQRKIASAMAKSLATQLANARSHSYAMRSFAIDIVRTQLGPRVSTDPDLIDTDDGADAVRLTSALSVVAPRVEATKAGKAG